MPHRGAANAVRQTACNTSFPALRPILSANTPIPPTASATVRKRNGQRSGIALGQQGSMYGRDFGVDTQVVRGAK